jgi:putative copper resistance protein D
MRARPAFGLLVGVPILLLVLYTLGGLTETRDVGLPTVPWLTLLTLPIDRWARDIAMALTIGAVMVGGLLAPSSSARLRRLAIASAVLWLVAVISQVVLTVSEVLALPWTRVWDASAIRELLTQTDLGRVMIAQLALVGVAILIIAWGRTRQSQAVALALLLVAAWLPGLTGHAGMDHGHVAAAIALGVHIACASLWVGGLVAAAIYIAEGGAEPGVLLRRFSVLALISVIAIAETGLLNASLRLDGPAALLTSAYGAIILAKVAVLVVLIGWGWRHRRAMADDWDVSVPRDGRVGRSTFLRWAGWEVLWMGAVYGLSIALSRTAPPGPVLSGDAVTLASLVLLLLAIPMAVTFTAPSLLSRFARLRAYPEAVAVVSVICVVVAGTWQASALAGATAGVQVAAVLTVVLLITVGLVLSVTLRASRLSGVITLVGLPVALWWIHRDAVAGWDVGTWSVLLLAEGLVAWAAFGAGRSTGPSQDVESSAGTSERKVLA